MLGQAMFRRLLVLIAIVSTTFFVAGRARGDLQVAGYEDRLHDPFYVGSDKAFVGASYNWSGYGRWEDPTATGSNWKQVTMISDNYFLTANHNKPNRSDDPAGVAPKVRFYRTTDPNGEYWESEIAVEAGAYKGTRIESTDLWVGKLAKTPPSWVTRYPLAKRQEATNYLSYTDNDLFIFGQDSPRSATSVRVGRNEINQVSSYGTYQWSYDPTAGLGADEAQTQSGDSGGPSFFSGGRVPVLAGTHYRTNLDTGVSKNLQSIIDAVGEPISISTGLVGDLNGNSRVNAADFFIMTANFGLTGGARYDQGDITGDGVVDIRDFFAMSINFNTSLFAPSDFDRDGDVDGSDLTSIGNNWLKPVSSPYTLGDANGDAYVNLFDLMAFDRNQNRAYFGPLPTPLSPIAGDLNGDGIVNEIDLNTVSANLNRQVTPGTYGDLNRNGIVDAADLSVVSSALGDSFGDISGDHLIGPADFVILANNWNRLVTGGRTSGDMNGDGRVNALDAFVLFDWWGMRGGTFGDIQIPEPSSVLLVLTATGVAASVRRRRSQPKRHR